MDNKIICWDCLQVMQSFPDECINLTVTSPPYDELRDYNWFSWDFLWIVDELYRITKDNWVIVWVVWDQVINGWESGNSFRQALTFMQAWFLLHDTMIYEKNSSAFPANRKGNRYTQIFEYMFVFSKGKPKCNLLCDKPNKWAWYTNWGKNTQYEKDGTLKETSDIKPVPDFSPRNNIWKYSVGFNDKTWHPAVFPEKLAEDHILSWSNEWGTVLDPFAGSGTTLKMAKENNRNYIWIEISQDYCNIINKRLYG